MLWSCQTPSTKNDGLDQYPIFCLHAQSILGAKGKNWRLKMSIPITKNSDNYSLLKKSRCNFHRVYYLIRFLKTWTIKSVLDFWKRIMSWIVSQVELKTENTLSNLDQYPIFCSSDQYALILSNTIDEKWQARPIPNTLLARAEHPL